MFSYVCKGILIGLLFGLPAGAVGAMTVQRTWVHGIRAGLLTGLGSSVADCLYACVGAFGLTVISDFLLRYQMAIHLSGGALILAMGICLLVGKKEENAVSDAGAEKTGTSKSLGMFMSSFVIGMTNPAAIVTFLFAFSYFGISGQTGLLHGFGLVGGVFAGTYIWWGLLSMGVNVWKQKKKKDCFARMNRIFGVILCGFAAVVFIRTIFA